MPMPMPIQGLSIVVQLLFAFGEILFPFRECGPRHIAHTVVAVVGSSLVHGYNQLLQTCRNSERCLFRKERIGKFSARQITVITSSSMIYFSTGIFSIFEPIRDWKSQVRDTTFHLIKSFPDVICFSETLTMAVKRSRTFVPPFKIHDWQHRHHWY